jgi:hypothetical protein
VEVEVVRPVTDDKLVLQPQALSARAAQQLLQPMEEEEAAAVQQVAIGLLEPTLIL